MTYTKPEINVLGGAASVIQNGAKVTPGFNDPTIPGTELKSAYDLDE
jgi:hypothetical protein